MDVRCGFFVVIAIVGASCSSKSPLDKAQDADSVILKIGPVYLTKSEMESRVLELGPEYVPYLRTNAGKKTVLGAIVKQKIMVRAALERGMGKGALVKQELSRLKKDQERAVRLYRESLLTESLLEQLRDHEIKVSDDEIAGYYQEHHTLYNVRQILVADKGKAQEIYEDLGKKRQNLPSEFARAALGRSLESQSAKEGGKIPPFLEGELEGGFVQAAKDLKPGQMSAPVQTNVGFHLIYLDGTATAPLNDEYKERARRILERGKMDALFNLWKTKYMVEVRDESLKPYLEF